jgi:transposase-like protein
MKAALVELVKEGDYLRTVVEEVVQQILEAEMDGAWGAEKSERTSSRRRYRSGHYQRTLITRVGRLELRVPQDRRALPDGVVRALSAKRGRRWWDLWRRCACKECRPAR